MGATVARFVHEGIELIHIAPRQLADIAAQRLDALAPRVDAWLETRRPDWRLAPDRAARTRALMHRARIHGMLVESDYALFVLAVVDWPGQEAAFFADPDIATILAADWNPASKLLQIDDRRRNKEAVPS